MAQSSAPLEGSSSDEPPEEYPSTEEGNRKSVSDEGSSSPEFNFASTDFQLQLQRTVFVANLSLSTRPHHLLEFFKDAGTVCCYCFHYNKQNGMFLRQCLVELDTVEATNKVRGRVMERQFTIHAFTIELVCYINWGICCADHDHLAAVKMPIALAVIVFYCLDWSLCDGSPLERGLGYYCWSFLCLSGGLLL